MLQHSNAIFALLATNVQGSMKYHIESLAAVLASTEQHCEDGADFDLSTGGSDGASCSYSFSLLLGSSQRT